MRTNLPPPPHPRQMSFRAEVRRGFYSRRYGRSSRFFKAGCTAADGEGVSAFAQIPVTAHRSFVLFRWPVPIVVTGGGLVPVAAFALIFVAFSTGARPATIVAAALLGGIGGAISLIVHELGHVRAARTLPGVEPAKVSLIWLGAATHLDGVYRSGREQARMALGGPAASLAFALLLTASVVLPTPMWLKIGALGLASLNVVIGLLTLLPVHPLDGHKLVVGLVWWAAGSEARAERIVKRAGFGFLAVDVSVGMFLLQDKPFIGLVIVALAATAYAQKHLVGRPTRF